MSTKAPAISQSSPRATVPPVDHALEAARNRMLALVYDYMSIWDRNSSDAAALIDLLSPEGFTITDVAANRIMTTIAAVQTWYAEFPKLVKQDNHIVESVAVSPLPGGAWQVRIHVRAQGISADGSPFLVRRDHLWEVVDYGGLLPRIARLTVSLVGDAARPPSSPDSSSSPKAA
jgi:hypothetical protein